MRYALLVFCYFFGSSLSYNEDYIDFMQPFYIKKYNYQNFPYHFPYKNLYDGSFLEFTSLKENSEHFVEFTIVDPFSFELDKIRILKLRNETEKLKMSFLFNDGTDPYEFLYDYDEGWNEILFDRLTNIVKFRVTLNETIYQDLKIGEFQFLGHIKEYMSCQEWISHSKGEATIIGFDVFSSEYFDAAKFESGSTCKSSTGDCKAAFEDSVKYIDYLWKPLSTDQNIFIQVDFYKEYHVEEIFIKQPKENSIEKILLKNKENLKILYINRKKELNNWKIELKTKFLKFLIDKKENDIFLGFFYIQAFSYKFDNTKFYCQDYGIKIRYGDVYSSQGKKLLSPKSDSPCSAKYAMFTEQFV